MFNFEELVDSFTKCSYSHNGSHLDCADRPPQVRPLETACHLLLELPGIVLSGQLHRTCHGCRTWGRFACCCCFVCGSCCLWPRSVLAWKEGASLEPAGYWPSERDCAGSRCWPYRLCCYARVSHYTMPPMWSRPRSSVTLLWPPWPETCVFRWCCWARTYVNETSSPRWSAALQNCSAGLGSVGWLRYCCGASCCSRCMSWSATYPSYIRTPRGCPGHSWWLTDYNYMCSTWVVSLATASSVAYCWFWPALNDLSCSGSRSRATLESGSYYVASVACCSCVRTLSTSFSWASFYSWSGTLSTYWLICTPTCPIS